MSLELAKKERRLSWMMEVERVSKGPIETNIDPHLHEEESTTRPIEELVEIQVDPKEPSRVFKVANSLSCKLGRSSQTSYVRIKTYLLGHMRI